MITGVVRRNTEASLLVITLVIALGGYWLAALSRSPTMPAGMIGYGLTFLLVYAGIHYAVRTLAPRADPLLLPIALMLNAVGFVLIYRLEDAIDSPGLAAAQARCLIVSALAFAVTLW